MRFRRAALLRKAGYCLALTEPRRADVAVDVDVAVVASCRAFAAPATVLASMSVLAMASRCSRT